MTGTNIDLLERARAIQRKSIEFRENGIEVILPEKDFKAVYPRLALVKEMEGIFPDLVKEIEHLREQTDWQHKNALKWRETCDELEDEKNQWKGRYLELKEDREQEMSDEDKKEIIDLDAELTAKDTEIERLRSRDKEMAAAIVSMADSAKRYILMNSTITDSVFKEADSLIGYSEKLEKIVIAKDARIKELEDALEDVGDCQSIAYMLGGKKKAEENKVLIDYVKRLEAAFLEAKRGAIYFQDAPSTRMMLADLWDVADKKAREALERIKEEKG